MACFEEAVAFVLDNEGGYSDNPNDSGGATNHGISLRFLKTLPVESLKKYGFFGDLIVDDVKGLSQERAVAIYRGEFWDSAPFEGIKNQHRANYIFDCCVNHGLGTGIKMVQRACWVIHSDFPLKDDGIMGEKTLFAINNVSLLMISLMATRAEFMRGLGKGEFLNGWLKRCYRI